MGLKHTETAKIIVVHCCLNEGVGKIILLRATPLERLLHHCVLHIRSAILAVEALGTVGIYVLGVRQALKHAVGEASVAQVL